MGKSLLRARDSRALLDALDELYQPQRPTEFPNHLFGVLSRLLPGTLHSLDAVELATGKVESHVTPMVASVTPVADLEMAVRAHVWQNPAVDHLAKYPASIIQLSELISHREFTRTDFYQSCHRPLEIKHQIVAGIDRAGYAGAFIVNRGGSRGFSAREMEMITRLRPHVARAYANALRTERPPRAPEAPAGHGTGTTRSHFPPPATSDPLTEREAEVLQWLSAGKRNAEIATILGISTRTIQKHVEHILAKLGVETRTAAALTQVH